MCVCVRVRRERACFICPSRTHQVRLISETFGWDTSQLGLRSEAVIVYWFRLGCSVQSWELLLQSTDCNDGEPSTWQCWLHQPVAVSTFHPRYFVVLCSATNSYSSLYVFVIVHIGTGSPLQTAILTSWQFYFIHLLILVLNYKEKLALKLLHCAVIYFKFPVCLFLLNIPRVELHFFPFFSQSGTFSRVKCCFCAELPEV